MAKLTDKQQRFANEYLVDFNATQAAIRAGYSKKTAGVIGRENLIKPYIKSYIDEQLKKIEDESIANATEVMKYLTKVMRNETLEEVVIVCEGGCVKVNKKPSEKDKLKAAELLGKRYRLFTDKIEADVTQTVIFEGEDDILE